MSQQYTNLSAPPSYTNASGCGCGGYRATPPTMAPSHRPCTIVRPPPRRIACQPAPWSAACCGNTYQPLTQAYGKAIEQMPY